MQRIKQASEVSYTINRSRFVGYALPCADGGALRARLAEIVAAHPNAHHLVFAYRIGSQAHCSDGGEPSGTAGRPVLAQLEGRDIMDGLVAVVRYFGGIKLGPGGLVRAYGGTARMALDAAVLVPHVACGQIRLRVDYARLQHLEYQVDKIGGEILSKDFGAQVDLVIRAPEAELASLRQQFGQG